MSKFIDLAGQKYGSLLVLERAPNYESPNGRKEAQWQCLCDCGNVIIASASHLKSGHTTSCGCYRSKVAADNITIYNKTATRKTRNYSTISRKLHSKWKSMKVRCYNKDAWNYKYYGGKGIKICDEWMKFKNFQTWAFQNGYHDGLTIDRIDNNKDYCPENCRWATIEEQANNRSNNHFVTYNGETHTCAQWDRILNLGEGTINQRVAKGWDIEKVINYKKGRKECLEQ